MRGPVHALTIDVEDLASGLLLRACDRIVPPTSGVVDATDRLLRVVDDYGFKATWFFLGEVAERYPDLVRRLSDGGHEIGVHGWHHHRVFDLSVDDYRTSLVRARSLLKSISGQLVSGYRAVEFSISDQTNWAYGVLHDVGFRYSSSVFPIRGRRYGDPSAPLVPYRVGYGSKHLMEIPMTALRIGPIRIPALGGGYFRHFPLWYSKFAFRHLSRAGRAGVMYLHPHEIHTAKPEEFSIECSREEKDKIQSLSRTYFRNIDKTEGKLRWIFSRYRFSSIRDVFFRSEARSTAQSTRDLLGPPECK